MYSVKKFWNFLQSYFRYKVPSYIAERLLFSGARWLSCKLFAVCKQVSQFSLSYTATIFRQHEWDKRNLSLLKFFSPWKILEINFLAGYLTKLRYGHLLSKQQEIWLPQDLIMLSINLSLISPWLMIVKNLLFPPFVNILRFFFFLECLSKLVFFSR